MLAPERNAPPSPGRFPTRETMGTPAKPGRKIHIEFISEPPVEPTIKTRLPMKKNRIASARLAPTPDVPAFSTEGSLEPAVLSEAPFTDLMLHPEKIDALLKGGPAQITAHSDSAPSSAAKSATLRSRKSSRKKTTFHLQGHAKSVRLAGDFTDWEKLPIDMVSDGDGQWSAVVSLEPGQYAYRFIVDGNWCDDPNCTRRVANAFGSENSVIEVS